MSRLIVLSLIFLLCVVPAAAQFQTAGLTVSRQSIVDLPYLTISVESIDPVPVEPGEDVTVKIRITNQGGSNAQGLSVFLETPHVFALKTQERWFEDITLCAGCSKENTYYLKVDEEATTGVYGLNFYAQKSDATILYDQKVNIEVRGKPELVFAANTVDEVVPNSNFQSAIRVRNIGTGKARVIRVSPQSEDFIVLGSTVQTIDTLLPGEGLQMPFEFTASENTIADVYNIPIAFEYLDEIGDAIEDTHNLGVRVVNFAELNLQSAKVITETGARAVSVGEPFSLIVRVENVGYGDADYTEVKLDCPFEGTTTGFIGNLERDEDAPSAFEVVAKKAGYFVCPVTMKYRDDLGWHEVQQTIDIQVYNGWLGKLLPWMIAVLVVAGGLVLWEKKKKQ